MFSILLNSILTINVSAHNKDYFAGSYTAQASCNQKHLKFGIESSAQTSLLDSSVYNVAFVWNHLSSNVNVGIVYAAPEMPSSGFYPVVGKTLPNGTLGQTVPRNANGDIVGADSNWSSVTIYINNSSSAFSRASNPKTAAKKTFIHEVGHALKLAHQKRNSSLSNHVYNGIPKAVMNQGYPNSTSVASTIVSHDKSNLKTKWGA